MRRPLIRTIATLLLAGQSVAAAGVGFAHGAERVWAPPAIEAEHGSACVVVHEPARCPGCQAVGIAAPPTPSRPTLALPARRPRPVPPPFDTLPSDIFRRTAAPRAPPASLSV